MSPTARVSIARLVPQIYDELRRIARARLRSEKPGHLLQPTALVHEAYLRLSGNGAIRWRGKTHFLAVAAVEMRRVLTEHARAAGARKRGAGITCITLDENVASVQAGAVDLLALDQSLEHLAARSWRQARVAEMRLFSGMSAREIAEVLEVSERTVKGDWQVARAWLARDMGPGALA